MGAVAASQRSSLVGVEGTNAPARSATDLRLGRALRSLPAAEAAWRRGDISGHHVEALASAVNQSDVARTAMVRDEADLVDAAVESRFSQFVRRLAYWRQAVDTEGSQAAQADRRAARRAHLSQSVFGLWFLDACLDPISGSILDNALRRIVDELFTAEWAATKASLGRMPTVADLPRTPAQRRADALVELATRACANPPGSRRPEPLFTVLVGWETLAGRICELSDGTVLDPSALDPWLDVAVAERVVFDSPSRVIDVGVRRRLFTGATRRAIEVRDRECFHDSCEVPADQCEGDHDKPYRAGGLTTTDNGRPGGPFHNRNRTPDDPPAA